MPAPTTLAEVLHGAPLEDLPLGLGQAAADLVELAARVIAVDVVGHDRTSAAITRASLAGAALVLAPIIGLTAGDLTLEACALAREAAARARAAAGGLTLAENPNPAPPAACDRCGAPIEYFAGGRLVTLDELTAAAVDPGHISRRIVHRSTCDSDDHRAQLAARR